MKNKIPEKYEMTAAFREFSGQDMEEKGIEYRNCNDLR